MSNHRCNSWSRSMNRRGTKLRCTVNEGCKRFIDHDGKHTLFYCKEHFGYAVGEYVPDYKTEQEIDKLCGGKRYPIYDKIFDSHIKNFNIMMDPKRTKVTTKKPTEPIVIEDDPKESAPIVIDDSEESPEQPMHNFFSMDQLIQHATTNPGKPLYIHTTPSTVPGIERMYFLSPYPPRKKKEDREAGSN